MKKIIFIIIISLMFAGCLNKTEESEKLITFTIDYIEKNVDGIIAYQANGKEYKYRAIVTGRSNNAVYDNYYIVLSNEENIFFEEVDKSYWSSELSLIEKYCIVEVGQLMEK